MRTIVSLVVLGALLGSARIASAGPVKHWAALPGREIRTVRLNGGVAEEPLRRVVAGRDGWVYVRVGDALHRLLGTDGSTTEVASFAWCDSREAAAIIPFATPGFACVAKHTIVETTGGAQYRRVLPLPDWDVSDNVYRYDAPFVTWIERNTSGRWWFGYGYAGGLGYADPDGTTTLRRVAGMPRMWGAAAVGADVFAVGEDCALFRIRGFRVRGREQLCGRPYGVQLVRAGEAVWVLFDGGVERRTAHGRARSWMFGVAPMDVAYDARARTAYVLGAEMQTGRNQLIAIGPDDVPHVTRLPMTGGNTIAVDARHRIWIGVPSVHSLAVIAPPGAWG